MTAPLVPTQHPSSVPVQNPQRGPFLAERSALAVEHLAEARRLCEVLEAVLASGAPIEQHQFQTTAKLAMDHVRRATSNALIKLEVEGQA